MMETMKVGRSEVLSSRMAYGCMRIVGDGSGESRERGKRAVRTAMEEGYTHFDHADIYGGGESERVFAEVLRESPSLRQEILITGKCGILRRGDPHPEDPGRYDLSKGHILGSVEGSLSRLCVEHLDILLLHRPDYLFDAEEVADAFRTLRESGKVLHFGVSNFTPSQVSLLQSCWDRPLLINQVEINIHNVGALSDGTLDQCRERGITPQAWSPLGGVAYSARGNTFTQEDETRIRAEFARQARKYGAKDWILMLAWLLRHPAGIMPVLGTTTPSRIRAAKRALDIPYSREDWYRLLEARNGYPVP